VSTQIN